MEPIFDHEKLDVYCLGLQFVAWIASIPTKSALERSALLTNRPRPRLLLVSLERYQPVGSIDYGFFEPATALSGSIIEDEDEDEFEDDNLAEKGTKTSFPIWLVSQAS